MCYWCSSLWLLFSTVRYLFKTAFLGRWLGNCSPRNVVVASAGFAEFCRYRLDRLTRPRFAYSNMAFVLSCRWGFSLFLFSPQSVEIVSFVVGPEVVTEELSVSPRFLNVFQRCQVDLSIWKRGELLRVNALSWPKRISKERDPSAKDRVGRGEGDGWVGGWRSGERNATDIDKNPSLARFPKNLLEDSGESMRFDPLPS